MIYNLTALRGDTLTLNLTFTQNGVPVSISGWAVFFTVKIKEDDPDISAVISKKVTTHTDPAHGQTSIVVTAAETNALLGQYFYDIQYVDTTGTVKTPAEGNITFVRDITRRVT